MALDFVVRRLASLGLECSIGRGAEGDVLALLEKYPQLRRFFDYVEFVAAYGGAVIYSADRRPDRDFVSVTIYGSGTWEFTEESDTALTADGEYYTFAVIQERGVGECKDKVAAFAFRLGDSTGTAVYGQAQEEGRPPGQFVKYCSNFTEWLLLLVEAKGYLPLASIFA